MGYYKEVDLVGIFKLVEDSFQAFLKAHGLLSSSTLLFLEEAGIPLPVPGDAIIAYTGYQVSRGALQLGTTYLALVASAVTGASVLFHLSSHYGQKLVLLISRITKIEQSKFDTVEVWFKKYGIWVVIFGRHIPGFRIPVTIFAGTSQMNYGQFLAGTILSITAWVGFYLYLGQKLGPRTVDLLHAHTGFFLYVIVPVILIVGAILLYRHLRD